MYRTRDHVLCFSQSVQYMRMHESNYTHICTCACMFALGKYSCIHAESHIRDVCLETFLILCTNHMNTESLHALKAVQMCAAFLNANGMCVYACCMCMHHMHACTRMRRILVSLVIQNHMHGKMKRASGKAHCPCANVGAHTDMLNPSNLCMHKYMHIEVQIWTY